MAKKEDNKISNEEYLWPKKTGPKPVRNNPFARSANISEKRFSWSSLNIDYSDNIPLAIKIARV